MVGLLYVRLERVSCGAYQGYRVRMEAGHFIQSVTVSGVQEQKGSRRWRHAAIISIASFAISAVALYCLLTYRPFPPHKTGKTKQTIKVLIFALEFYGIDESGRTCPENLSELVNQKYIHSLPKDAWGEDFIYRCPGEKRAGEAEVISKGPDKILGTEDDLRSWELKF